MDRSNWKFKKDHDIHVSKWLSIIFVSTAVKKLLLLFLTVFDNFCFSENIKYKRNHGITSLNQRDKKVMK